LRRGARFADCDSHSAADHPRLLLPAVGEAERCLQAGLYRSSRNPLAWLAIGLLFRMGFTSEFIGSAIAVKG